MITIVSHKVSDKTALIRSPLSSFDRRFTYIHGRIEPTPPSTHRPALGRTSFNCTEDFTTVRVKLDKNIATGISE